MLSTFSNIDFYITEKLYKSFTDVVNIYLNHIVYTECIFIVFTNSNHIQMKYKFLFKKLCTCFYIVTILLISSEPIIWVILQKHSWSRINMSSNALRVLFDVLCIFVVTVLFYLKALIAHLNNFIILEERPQKLPPPPPPPLGSVPPPPPPPIAPLPTPPPTPSAETLRKTELKRTVSRQSIASMGGDAMQEELNSVLTLMREKQKIRPALDIKATPETYIDEKSNPKQVQDWLKAKDFNEVICNKFKGVNGYQLLIMTKEDLAKVCGEKTGGRMYSFLLVQRSVSKVSKYYITISKSTFF